VPRFVIGFCVQGSVIPFAYFLLVHGQRLVEKSAAMAKDVGVMHSLMNGWSVAEARSGSPQRFEMRHTLDRTSTLMSLFCE
jgi:hypothetical protein